MREDDIVASLIDEVETATPSGINVRTSGGDQNVDPPEVILDWNTDRLSDENGHKAFGGYVYDSNDNKIGVQFHSYWRFEADFQLRYYDEVVRDETMDTIQMHFLPYEDTPDAFNTDTREWEVGATGPRNDPVREPDWYSVGVMVMFEFLKRTDVTSGYDTIDTIQRDVSVDESLEDTSSTTN
jgi:hypothetical protein